MAKPPVRTRWYLRPLTYLLSLPDVLAHNVQVHYDGTYSSGELPVEVHSLPNSKKFIVLGRGTMVHDMNGFSVCVKDLLGKEFTMEIPVSSAYSVHIEYNYLGKWGDCVDLNTLTDTWYTYPKIASCSVTKMALATEELYFAHRRSIGKPCKPGLA